MVELKEGEQYLVVRKPDGSIMMWDLYHFDAKYIIVDCITGKVKPSATQENMDNLVKDDQTKLEIL